jgi:hypothetical protein
VIKDEPFSICSDLTIVVLDKGLEEIGKGAFSWCTLLHEIVTPPTIRAVNSLSAMDGCDRPLKN